jgi:hypothetical protein
MGIINRYAKGLLHVLDAQSQGDTPGMIGDVIAPTMEISEYLLASKGSEIVTSGTVVFTGLGQQLSLIVPVGETWFVRGAFLEFIAREVIVTTWRFALYHVTPSLQYPMTDSGAGVSFGVIGQNSWAHEWFTRPLVMRSGDQIGTTCGTASGAIVLGVNTSTSLLIDRLTV